MRFISAAAALATAVAFAGPAAAADLPVMAAAPLAPVAAPSGWQYQVSGYGFLSWINGNVGVGKLPTSDVYIPLGTLLEHLQGVFAGNAVARNETFYLSIDGMWAKIGGTASFKLSPGPFAGSTASLTENMGIVTAYAGYRLPLGSPDFSLYATVGGRYQGLSANFGLHRNVTGFGANVDGSAGWVDPLVGLAMHYRINDKYFLDGTADIGGFGVASNITSQEQLTVGYNWTQSISTSVGYRILYTDYEHSNGNGGSFRYNTTLYGPYIGASYNF